MDVTNWGAWALALVLLINTVLIGVLAGTLILINKKVDEGLAKATPLIQKTTETLARVEETTNQLQQRVDHVLDRTTALVDVVSQRVDTTTAIAEEAVTEPLIGAASLMAGIQQGLRVYSQRTSAKGDGKNGG